MRPSSHGECINCLGWRTSCRGIVLIFRHCFCPSSSALSHPEELTAPLTAVSDSGVQDACRADGEDLVSCRGLQAGTPALMFATDRQVPFLSCIGVIL